MPRFKWTGRVPFAISSAAAAPLSVPHAHAHTRTVGAAHRQIKGVLSPMRTVPATIAVPPYAQPGGRVAPGFPPSEIHDGKGIARMRAAAAIARDVLAYACENVRVGMTTDEIDRLVHEKCVALGVYPSPLGYAGFPKSVCVSVNEVVCHGIPDTGAIVLEGDIVKIDVSTFVNGYHGDTCRTVIAGGTERGDAEAQRLVSTTKRALDTAIAALGPGMPVSAIGDAIAPILEEEGYHAVREFAGHGIGQTFHTLPLVYHHRNMSGDVLRPGMTFTIEPMIVEGLPRIQMWPDAWTVVTADGGRTAQFEHTLLVTEHGLEVLTPYE